MHQAIVAAQRQSLNVFDFQVSASNDYIVISTSHVGTWNKISIFLSVISFLTSPSLLICFLHVPRDSTNLNLLLFAPDGSFLVMNSARLRLAFSIDFRVESIEFIILLGAGGTPEVFKSSSTRRNSCTILRNELTSSRRHLISSVASLKLSRTPETYAQPCMI